MLDDRERKLLVEIERRLLTEDPELVRSFGIAVPHGPGAPHGAVITNVARLTLCAVLLRGPRPLTVAEVVTLSSAGPPRVIPVARLRRPMVIPIWTSRGGRTTAVHPDVGPTQQKTPPGALR